MYNVKRFAFDHVLLLSSRPCLTQVLPLFAGAMIM